MTKNAFYFKMRFISCSKLFSFLRYLNFVLTFWLCRRLDMKAKVIFKIDGATERKTNNYNTYNVQYLKKYRQPESKDKLTEHNMRNIFLENSFTK